MTVWNSQKMMLMNRMLMTAVTSHAALTVLSLTVIRFPDGDAVKLSSVDVVDVIDGGRRWRHTR